jgi:protein subunit release factor B
VEGTSPEREGRVNRVVVTAGTGGEDAQDFARILREAYAKWAGPFYREPGVHRLVRRSPFDPQHRRHTAFVSVAVDGVEWAGQVRSYVLYPYTRAVDHRTNVETEDAGGVLAGDFSVFYRRLRVVRRFRH